MLPQRPCQVGSTYYCYVCRQGKTAGPVTSKKKLVHDSAGSPADWSLGVGMSEQPSGACRTAQAQTAPHPRAAATTPAAGRAPAPHPRAPATTPAAGRSPVPHPRTTTASQRRNPPPPPCRPNLTSSLHRETSGDTGSGTYHLPEAGVGIKGKNVLGKLTPCCDSVFRNSRKSKPRVSGWIEASVSIWVLKVNFRVLESPPQLPG